MKKEIINKLKEIEKKYNVEILMAIESGSRAWGFASKDSDYDVRCVHAGKVERYLGIEEPPKQINDFIGDLDIESWDIKKFAELTQKSNPQIAEWIRSPITYKDKDFIKKFRKVFDYGCSLEYLKIHYLRMAKQNFHKYMNLGMAHSCKKYLYVLRALACAEFIEKENKLPPLPYKEVISYLPKHVQKFFEKCVVTKNKTEDAKIKSDKKVKDFIKKNLEKVPRKRPDKEKFTKKKELEKFIINQIKKIS